MQMQVSISTEQSTSAINYEAIGPDCSSIYKKTRCSPHVKTLQETKITHILCSSQ